MFNWLIYCILLDVFSLPDEKTLKVLTVNLVLRSSHLNKDVASVSDALISGCSQAPSFLVPQIRIIF